MLKAYSLIQDVQGSAGDAVTTWGVKKLSGINISLKDIFVLTKIVFASGTRNGPVWEYRTKTLYVRLSQFKNI